MSIQLKTADDIEKLRAANLIVHTVLTTLREMLVPGVTTNDLDAKARELTKEHGATSAFFGYPAPSAGVGTFSWSYLCISK